MYEINKLNKTIQNVYRFLVGTENVLNNFNVTWAKLIHLTDSVRACFRNIFPFPLKWNQKYIDLPIYQSILKKASENIQKSKSY